MRARTTVGALATLISGTLVAATPATAALTHGTAAPHNSSAAPVTMIGNFRNFELGTSPVSGLGPTCPRDGSQCTNTAAEPAIRSDSQGNFYASSENGLGGGTQAWRSYDGGRSYTALPSPNEDAPGLAAGGGDTDIAVAPELNLGDKYPDVYVASLNLASVNVSTSAGGGQGWRQNPVAADVAADDREWIAAYEEFHVCISYHAISAGDQIAVQCSHDAGKTFPVVAVPGAIDANHAYDIDANELGNLAFDEREVSGQPHYLYQTFSGVDSATESATCQTTGPCYFRDVFMAVSTDMGKTFTDYLVHRGSATTDYEHQFVNVSVDRAGNVYSVFSDNHNVYYAYSTNHGKTWSAPKRVNQNPSNSAIEPWSTAGDNGKIDIVWYGTPYYDGTNPPDTYPNSAQWKVYLAQILDATTGRHVHQVTATPVVHTGGVCESGVTCTGNRDLYDDFGVAASPATGLASIIYSDDQFNSQAGAPNSAGCTVGTTDTSSCDHTAVATQVRGTGIFGP